jgi:hypothetical protein
VSRWRTTIAAARVRGRVTGIKFYEGRDILDPDTPRKTAVRTSPDAEANGWKTKPH